MKTDVNLFICHSDKPRYWMNFEKRHQLQSKMFRNTPFKFMPMFNEKRKKPNTPVLNLLIEKLAKPVASEQGSQKKATTLLFLQCELHCGLGIFPTGGPCLITTVKLKSNWTLQHLPPNPFPFTPHLTLIPDHGPTPLYCACWQTHCMVVFNLDWTPATVLKLTFTQLY